MHSKQILMAFCMTIEFSSRQIPNDKEVKTLTAEQLSFFLREVKETGVYEMYYTGLATGLRRGELLGLKWSDIDFNLGVIMVQRQVTRIDGEIVEAPLKTKNSYRNISISRDTIEVLKEQKKKVTGEYVFPSPNGGPISQDSVLNMLHRVLERAGLPQGSVPRSPAYLCNAGITKWCGHQNGFQYAGTLLRRIHFGYLYPRYNASADGGCKYNGKRVNRDTVTKRQYLERKTL